MLCKGPLNHLKPTNINTINIYLYLFCDTKGLYYHYGLYVHLRIKKNLVMLPLLAQKLSNEWVIKVIKSNRIIQTHS
jgi:hypothetical protein